MKNRKVWGVVLILAPFILLLLILFVQLFARLALSGSDGGLSAISSGINIVSIILGMLSVLGFLPSIVFGIILLTKGSGAQSSVNEASDDQNGRIKP